MGQSGYRRWEKGLVLLVFCLVAGYFLVSLATAGRRIIYPFQHLYGEAIILNQVRLIQAGESLYRDIEVPPYINTCYTPLYQMLLCLVSTDRPPSFAPGRAVSFFCALGVCLLILVNLRRLGLGLFLSLALSLYFLLAYPAPTWATLCRVDMLALLLMLIALSLLARWHGKGNAILAGLAAALSVLAKQSYALGAVALFVFLLHRRRRDLVPFCLAAGLLLGASCTFLQFQSGGEFLKHTISYNLHPFNARQLDAFALVFLRYHWPLLLGCAFYLLRLGCRSPFAYYLPVSLIIFLGTGKSGAAENYFLEFLAVSLVLTGGALQAYLSARSRPMRIAALALLLCAVLCGAQRPLPRLPSQEEYRAKLESLQVFRGINGNVLARDYEFVVLSGKPLLYEPHQMANLYHKGVFKAAGLLRDIRQGRFAMIQLYPFVQEEFFPSDFRRAVKENYRLAFSLHGRDYYFKTVSQE